MGRHIQSGPKVGVFNQENVTQFCEKIAKFIYLLLKSAINDQNKHLAIN